MKIRFEKRGIVSPWRILATTLVFAALALAFTGIIIAASGFNPLQVYGKMLSKVFFSPSGWKKMLNSSLALIMCGLSVALCLRMNLNNIGAEGQYAMGAVFGAWFVLKGPEVNGIPGSILLMLCCFLGGALWALVPAVSRAFWDVSESITTLMLNYIALIILSYLVLGPWKQRGQNVGQTEEIRAGLAVPKLGNTGVSAGILIAVLAAVIIFCIYEFTTDGYELTVIRFNPGAARYAGIDIRRHILTVMLVSGGLAGLAGYFQYAGVSGRVLENMPNNAGYTAIVIAFLARMNPLVVVIVSILFAGLQNSSASVQVMGVPAQIATMIQGAVMIFVIAGDFFQRNKLVITKEGKA